MSSPRVAAVVPDPSVRHRMEATLENEGLELVRIVGAFEDLESDGPAFDVAVIAEDMGDVRTAEVLRRMRDRGGAEHIVVARSDGDGHSVRRALEAGADGLIDAREIERVLVPAILAVHAGLIAVPTTVRRQIVPPALSYRERQVLALVVEGCTNSVIAQRLFLAESTVKSHLATAFAKLGVRSRRDATALILQSDDALGASVLALAQEHGAIESENGTRRFVPSIAAERGALPRGEMASES